VRPDRFAPAQRREGLGAFSHEAVACDPVERTLYLTEDADAGRFYRFTPTRWEDLTAGRLDVARTDETGRVEWLPADATGGTTYAGGEGIAYYDGQIVFTTKSDQRIRAYDPSRSTMEVLHEPGRAPEITGPDNEVFASNGDLYVCEDVAGEPDLVLLAADGSKASVMRMTGQPRSELAGAAFDPSGTRLYVSSQRGAGGPGLTYELSGPFDQLASAAAGSTSTGTTAGGAARADDTGGASSDDDSMLPVAGAVGATVVVALGGLAWLRNRRGTSTS
jgi:secreted PhoX family phosphatase